jgi:hypothetical protein
MPSSRKSSLGVVGLIGALLLAATAGAAAPLQASAPEPGVWQSHQLEFQFFGFTTTYSCDGLESKLRALLGQLGARADFHVESYGCARGPSMPDKFARVRLNFATLQPASMTDATAAATPTSGAWKSVALAPRRPGTLDSGDCELIEQFRDKVLPLFTTRAIQNQVSCVPHQVSAGFSLSFEVFAPAGKA